MTGEKGFTDINAAVAEFRNTENAYLVDVRTSEEQAEGVIPGCIRLPLNELAEAEAVMPDKDAKVFVYCLSGARAARAVTMLQVMGYENTVSIGGIENYTGEKER